MTVTRFSKRPLLPMAASYARLRALGEGEGDSRFGAANRENSSRGSEKRVDSRGSGELHRGHK